MLIQDKMTGEWYDPIAKFDELLTETVVVTTCKSVVGGWQTCITNTKTSEEQLVGPAFHKIQDLWAWQKQNRA